MTEAEALRRMVAPGTRRRGKFLQGVIQILVTRACDNACYGCTQGSNLGGKPMIMKPEQFEIAVKSLKGYFGVVGVFGGNPTMNPHFPELCEILKKHIPREQRGIWCNNPLTVENARIMRHTFDPSISNLNCHLSMDAYKMFKEGWPESMPFGVDKDSRHAPVHLAMKDVIADAGKRWELISNCDINQHWSALIGVFRNQVRAWFCEVAGSQAMLHEHEEDYPDTGFDVTRTTRDVRSSASGTEVALTGRILSWWQLPMGAFREQVKKHCHECGVPLRGYGERAMDTDPEATEQTSKTHEGIFKPKRKERKVQVVETLEQLGTGRVGRVIDYLQNGRR